MMQQQQMEEDQRWLEQEERLLVTLTACMLENTLTDTIDTYTTLRMLTVHLTNI